MKVESSRQLGKGSPPDHSANGVGAGRYRRRRNRRPPHHGSDRCRGFNGLVRFSGNQTWEFR